MPGDVKLFVDGLVDAGFADAVKDDQGRLQFVPNVPHLGTAQGNRTMLYESIQPAFANYVLHEAREAPSPQMNQEFIQVFGPLLLTSLFLENRLTTAFQVSHFDYEKQRPSNELQVIYSDGRLQSALSAEVRKAFGKAVWVDGTRGGILCVRTDDGPHLPSAEDRLDPYKMQRFRTIETEGDGLRSYCAVCTALLPSRRPLCLIDEPEVCLHPPQEHAIGQFIGRHAGKNNSTVFVATHSSQVLRGIVETVDALRIVRMTRSASGFNAHLVPEDLIKTSLRNPAIRADHVLDGIFADGVVVVEAETDRTVYQAAFEAARSDVNRDILFVPVGGLGGIAEVVAFFKALSVPVAVIADRDLLQDEKKLRRILEKLTDGDKTVERILGAVKTATGRTTLRKSAVEIVTVKGQLSEVMAALGGSSEVKGDELVQRLRTIASGVERASKHTSPDVGAVHAGDASTPSHEILDECEKWHLNLVPVGELEEWPIESLESGVARPRKKSLWADEAAALIRADPGKAPQLVDFVRRVATGLFSTGGPPG